MLKKVAPGKTSPDGSYAAPVYRWELSQALSAKEVQAVIDKSGLYGPTFGDGFVEAYFVGDVNDKQAISDFEQGAARASASLGSDAKKARANIARLWPHGRGDGGIGWGVHSVDTAGQALPPLLSRDLRGTPSALPAARPAEPARRPGAGGNQSKGSQVEGAIHFGTQKGLIFP